MNPNAIVKRLREGFRPFTLRLTDGRSHPVPHPEFIAVARSTVVVVDSDGDPIQIDPLDIVSLDDKAPKNGDAA